MEQIKVRVFVPAVVAIAAGRSQHGVSTLVLTDEQVNTLSAEERAELMTELNAQIGNSRSMMITMADPTFDALITALQAHATDTRRKVQREVEEKAERAAAVRAAVEAWVFTGDVSKRIVPPTYENDRNSHWRVAYPRVNYSDVPTHEIPPDLVESYQRARAEAEAEVGRLNVERRAHFETKARQHEEEQARKKQEEEGRKARYVAARNTLIQQFGSPSQRARLADGLLPSEEADALVHERVFAALRDQPRYTRMKASDVPHTDECVMSTVNFVTLDAESLDDARYAALRAIKNLAATIDGATVTPQVHRGTCTSCSDADEWREGEYAERTTALVEVEWHGRRLSREYALDSE